MMESLGSPAYKSKIFEGENYSHFRPPRDMSISQREASYGNRNNLSEKLSETSEFNRQQAQKHFIRLFDRENQRQC
jgi:hypothetical protein